MQDRYAGDIGDYGKIGLLKFLQSQGFSIGVNWYRVSVLDSEKKPDGSFKHDDGKYLIPERFRGCDMYLADRLTEIARTNRSVEAIENADLLPSAVFYSEYIEKEHRIAWHRRAYDKFADVDLIFLDPDNGLLVKSVGQQSAKSVKYAFYEEVKDYIDAGKSVLVYNHRSRKQERHYFYDIEKKIFDKVDVPGRSILEMTFPKSSVRDFFAIPASKDHFDRIKAAFSEMLKSDWGRLGVCKKPEWADIIPRWYCTGEDERFIRFKSESFIEGCSFEEYKRDILRYLTICAYRYTEECAQNLINRSRDFIKESYDNKEPVADVAIDVGYSCG